MTSPISDRSSITDNQALLGVLGEKKTLLRGQIHEKIEEITRRAIAIGPGSQKSTETDDAFEDRVMREVRVIKNLGNQLANLEGELDRTEKALVKIQLEGKKEEVENLRNSIRLSSGPGQEAKRQSVEIDKVVLEALEIELGSLEHEFTKLGGELPPVVDTAAKTKVASRETQVFKQPAVAASRPKTIVRPASVVRTAEQASPAAAATTSKPPSRPASIREEAPAAPAAAPPPPPPMPSKAHQVSNQENTTNRSNLLDDIQKGKKLKKQPEGGATVRQPAESGKGQPAPPTEATTSKAPSRPASIREGQAPPPPPPMPSKVPKVGNQENVANRPHPLSEIKLGRKLRTPEAGTGAAQPQDPMLANLSSRIKVTNKETSKPTATSVQGAEDEWAAEEAEEAAEATRKAEEATRKEEEARKKEEEARKKEADAPKKEAEETAEADRQAAEANRKEEEAAKKAAEEAAEAARKAADAAAADKRADIKGFIDRGEVPPPPPPPLQSPKAKSSQKPMVSNLNDEKKKPENETIKLEDERKKIEDERKKALENRRKAMEGSDDEVEGVWED